MQNGSTRWTGTRANAVVAVTRNRLGAAECEPIRSRFRWIDDVIPPKVLQDAGFNHLTATTANGPHPARPRPGYGEICNLGLSRGRLDTYASTTPFSPV